MGWLRTMGKRVALRVSSVVARNELFERYGERPVQPPLRPGTWVGPSGEQESEEDDQESDCRVDIVRDLSPYLNKAPAIVHHWATWCESCIDEMPMIRSLVSRSPVAVFGVSWDAFEAESAQVCVADVESVAKESGFTAQQLILDIEPEAFFDGMRMTFKQVPQTWLVNSEGETVFQIDGVMDEDGLQALLRAAEGVQ